MIFLRQKYKEKPRQYGPASEVQSSIFKNADSVGISEAQALAVLPYWSPGDQTDYTQKINAENVGDITFTKNRMSFDGSNDYIKLDNFSRLSLPNLASSFSLLLDFKGQPQMDRRFFSFGGEASRFWGFGTDYSSPYRKFRSYHSSVWYGGAWNIKSSGDIANGNQNHLCFSVEKDEYFSIYINGVLDSSHYRNSGLETTATPYITIGAARRGSSLSGFSFCSFETSYFYFFSPKLSSDQVYLLHDNPYFLLNRVPPVFFSIPQTVTVFKPFWASQATRISL